MKTQELLDAAKAEKRYELAIGIILGAMSTAESEISSADFDAIMRELLHLNTAYLTHAGRGTLHIFETLGITKEDVENAAKRIAAETDPESVNIRSPI